MDKFGLTGAQFTIQVDGEFRVETKTEFYFPLKKLVEYVSEVQTIILVDIFTSGTLPDGSGCERKEYIHEGSVVEFEAEGMGILLNMVGIRGESVPLPATQQPWSAISRKEDL